MTNSDSQCPSCGGKPERPIFYCGDSSTIEIRQCPFCGGLGSVLRTRLSWRMIGQRLKAARLSRIVQIGDDNGRWVFTLDDDTPEQPMPVYAQAWLYDISERMLEQIENGNLDPWSIASKLNTLTWPLVETIESDDSQ